MTITEIQFPKRIEALPRVAAYARVSSGKDAMLQSLSSQVSYYSSLIQSYPAGFTQASMRMRPRQEPKTPARSFRGCSKIAGRER